MKDQVTVLLLMITHRIASFSFRVARNNGLRSMSNLPTTCKGSTWKSSSSTVRFMSASDYGKDMDQDALMESDMLIAVDENDVLIPNVELSKRGGHTFSAETPRATLHRAFSFFLFDKNGRMLLTQRAGSKITFPNVWTNTCCSHPLYGMTPNEADVVPDAYPSFPGIKHAAIRKLGHELGIDPSYIDHESIQFVGRFHYWASDTVTYGSEAPWGEHEVDYILFFQSQQDVPVQANPEEVSDYKYVTIDELRDMLKDQALIWSPWFRGMLDRGIFDWWGDLEGSLAGKYTNDEVVFFDPPKEHFASYNLPVHGRRTGVLSTNLQSTQ